MKPGLVAVLAAAALLLGTILYWKSRSVAEPAPVSAAPAASAQSASAPALSAETPAPGDARVDPGAAADPRTAAAPAPVLEPTLEGDLASNSGEITAPLPTSIDEVRSAGDELFAKRYEGTSAADRRSAIESIKLVLEAYQSGNVEKGQTLTDEEIRNLKNEIEWLSLHEIP